MADSTGKTYQQVAPTDFSAANRLMNEAMKQQMLGGLMLGKAFTEGGQIAQDRRDADYYSQLNQYANDPLGMAQALQNGTINSSGISDAASKATAEYFNKAATNWKSNIDTAHTDMLNQQRQKYSSEVLDYKNALANNDLARATQIKNSVMSQDPSVSSEIFDGNLSFDKAKADAMMMQARAAMSGLANEERKRMSYDRYIEFMEGYYRTAGSDPNVKLFDFLNTLSPSEKAYFLEGIKGGSSVWNDLVKGSIAQTAMGEATKASTDTGAPYTGDELHFG